MKTLKFLSVGTAAFALVLATTVPVRAQIVEEAEPQTAQPTTTTQQATNANTTTQSAMKDRIEKRKAELKTKLTTAQQNRLQNRCKNAQGKLQSVTQKTTAAQQNREKIYTKLLDRIAELQPKLVAAGVDTTQIEASVTELKTAIESFKTSSAAYEQAVKDTAELDCQADPVAFQASLTSSRTALQNVRSDAAGIRTITNQKVKPALVAAKAKLSETKAE